jgi:tetratricopeptide (TPR) repeat protein
VAVLPFTNMGGDPEQVYFSDGITEDIITELARFRELLVIARNSSFSFRGKDVDVREVGRALNADYVVEGSVRRAGDRVRITAQLINAASGAHLWAERYDRRSRMSSPSRTRSRVGWSPPWPAASRRRPRRWRVAAAAGHACLRSLPAGHRLSDVFTDDGQARARAVLRAGPRPRSHLRQGVHGLAFHYLNRAADEGVGLPREQDPNRIEARRAAEQALMVDPTEPRVQSTAGYVFLTWREFDRAERHLDLAQAMNPNDATIQIFWAWAQACLGNPAKGLAAAELARRLNPRIRTGTATTRPGRCSSCGARGGRFSPSIPHDGRAHRASSGHAAAEARFGLLGKRSRLSDAPGGSWKCQGRVARRSDAGPPEYVDWFVDTSYLRRAEDEALLREGLRLAGLPA